MPDKESETFYFGYKERRTETDGVDSRSAENYVRMCSACIARAVPTKGSKYVIIVRFQARLIPRGSPVCPMQHIQKKRLRKKTATLIWRRRQRYTVAHDWAVISDNGYLFFGGDFFFRHAAIRLNGMGLQLSRGVRLCFAH